MPVELPEITVKPDTGTGTGDLTGPQQGALDNASGGAGTGTAGGVGSGGGSAITKGVAPENGWVEINGQRFQVIHCSVTFTSTGADNKLNAKLPLTPKGYFETLVPLTGNEQKISAIVQGQSGTYTLMQNATIKEIVFELTHTTINIQALGGLYKLAEHKTTDTFTNQKGHQVVGTYVQRVGLPFSAMASKVMAGKKVGQDYVKLTNGDSYFTVAHMLGQLDGRRLYMDEQGTVNYKPAGTGDTYSVHWKKPDSSHPMVSDCLDIRVRHNLDASAPRQVTVSGWKHSEKKNNTATYTAPGTGTPIQDYQEIPNVEPTQAQEYALNKAEQGASHEWELQVTVVGDPSIKVSGNIQLSGTGTVMDQTYPIDTVTHNFGINGYTTTVNSKGKKGGNGGGE
jgi:hypothetical protein